MNLKFRAWHKEHHLMFTGFDIGRLEGHCIDVNADNGNRLGVSEFDYWLIDSCEIMLWTGLRDKNKKDIYDGDFIKFLDKDEIYEVDWSMGGFWACPINVKGMLDSSGKDWKGVGHTDCEIIGNKFETCLKHPNEL